MGSYIYFIYFKNAVKKHPLQNRTNVQIKGGGSKAFWTMLKKTALFLRDGFPNVLDCWWKTKTGVNVDPWEVRGVKHCGHQLGRFETLFLSQQIMFIKGKISVQNLKSLSNICCTSKSLTFQKKIKIMWTKLCLWWILWMYIFHIFIPFVYFVSKKFHISYFLGPP